MTAALQLLQPTPARSGWPAEPLGLRDYWSLGQPRRNDLPIVAAWKRRNLPNLARGLRRLALARLAGRATGLQHPEGVLWMTVMRGDGEVEEYGLASVAVVTDVGCQKIVAVMNTSDASTATILKFHGIGTGTTAEASTDTALVTELTTQYNPDNTRATGTQTTGATTKVYRTVATNTLDSGTPAITEHGIFSQAATGGGSLLDRSVFAAINLNGANGDGLQTTYDFTMVSGG